jgi:hypothetical protein
VRYSPTYFALTHQRTLTVDGRESAIMTLNLDGLYPSRRDYAVLDSQPADVEAIVAAFNADYAGRRATAATGARDLVWSPHAAATVLVVMTYASEWRGDFAHLQSCGVSVHLCSSIPRAASGRPG